MPRTARLSACLQVKASEAQKGAPASCRGLRPTSHHPNLGAAPSVPMSHPPPWPAASVPCGLPASMSLFLGPYIPCPLCDPVPGVPLSLPPTTSCTQCLPRASCGLSFTSPGTVDSGVVSCPLGPSPQSPSMLASMVLWGRNEKAAGRGQEPRSRCCWPEECGLG